METILHQPNITRQVHHGKSFIRTHVQKMLKVINYLIMYSKKTQILELLRKKIFQINPEYTAKMKSIKCRIQNISSK